MLTEYIVSRILYNKNTLRLYLMCVRLMFLLSLYSIGQLLSGFVLFFLTVSQTEDSYTSLHFYTDIQF